MTLNLETASLMPRPGLQSSFPAAVPPLQCMFHLARKDNAMDAQEIVRARYPQVEARHQAAVHEDGGKRPTRQGYWVISPSAGQGTRVLGRGATEAEAWSRAATVVQAEE